ncbi:variant surface glycoprotein (VSG, atypical), putative [Trypanosoma brucei brucei TREU927]|uniref:Variant surface glycoprotein (VSG, atypical), putative n=1 Tax=Trypanosoma brucei brucei (strain 927/4 GUTat10.1) TaxID=185431 RepID=Q380X8_TRYB2|nr:variant surface glycoprotein [Trypanosoma brucei brucei TREU927]EAN80653.1 variant surface glycoprotein (VSG, atypical), putative [Trypanosoma brucei brucei TREU927]
MHQWIALILLLCAAATRDQVKGTNDKALTKNGLEHVCDIAAEVRAKEHVHADGLTAAADKLAANQAVLAKVRILIAAASTAQEALQLQAISAALHRTAAEEEAKFTKATAMTAIEAIRHSSYLLGGLYEYLHIAGQAKDGTNNGCFADDENAGSFYTTEQLKNQVQNCKAVDLDEKAGWADKQVHKPDGYKRKTDKNNLWSTNAKGCKIHGGGNNNGPVESATYGANNHVAMGLISLSSTDAQLTDLSSLAGAEGDSKKRHAAKAFNTLSKPALKVNTIELPDKNALKNLANFDATLAAAVGASKPFSGQEKEQAMEKLYGSKDPDPTTMFWQKLKGLKLSTDSHGVTKGTKLDEIRNLPLLTELETNYTISKAIQRNSLAAADACNCPTAHPKPEEKLCNDATGDEGKCETLKEKGCIFDRNTKKCELNKDVKAQLEKANQETGGNDGKDTNTTGSNSIVIYKVSLLLAFILL